MIDNFQWSARFDYDTRLYHFRVMRVLFPKAPLRGPGFRTYQLLARDDAGTDWVLCTFAVNGPLTDAERQQIIDMAPYHPTMEVYYGKRN